MDVLGAWSRGEDGLWGSKIRPSLQTPPVFDSGPLSLGCNLERYLPCWVCSALAVDNEPMGLAVSVGTKYS